MLRRTRCPHCKAKLEAGQRIHPECIDAWSEKQAAKAALKAQREARARAKVDRATDRARRRALETIPELKKDAQRWFNKFIRLRDREKGCYVCLKPFPFGRLGGDFDAGHVRSCGSADHLRYREDNCFGECKSCNSSWGATQEQKEAGAARRIGQECWDAVKCDNSEMKWTRDGLRETIAIYKAKCKELEKRTSWT